MFFVEQFIKQFNKYYKALSIGYMNKIHFFNTNSDYFLFNKSFFLCFIDIVLQ